MLNDKFMAGLLGLVPDYLPWTHSIQCMCAFSVIAVTVFGVNLYFLFHKVVILRCGEM